MKKLTKNSHPIKIAFCGTASTGKTTLLNEFKKRYKKNPKVAFVEEAAREYFTLHPYTDRSLTATQEKIQKLALEKEQKVQDSGETFIFCDRSVIDSAAYALAYGDKKGTERLFQKVAFWLPTYSIFFLLDPSDIPYSSDKVRLEDVMLRRRIHLAFIDLFTQKHIPYILINGTVKERVKKVDARLCQLIKTSSLGD